MTHVFVYLVIASSITRWQQLERNPYALIWMFAISSAKVSRNPGDLTLISLGQAWFAVLR